MVRAGLESATSRFQVWHPNHSATLPPLTFNIQGKSLWLAVLTEDGMAEHLKLIISKGELHVQVGVANPPCNRNL